MQQYSLLHTKLHIPPVRPELVPRPRLTERLNAALPNRNPTVSTGPFALKLTVVSAPAGFGKTTLVSEWLAHLRLRDEGTSQAADRAAWVSLDEADNDPIRFLAYLVAALQTLEADIGEGALQALSSPRPPPVEIILTSLINEMAGVSGRIILVLDDYHLIEAQAVHDALTFLLEHLPSRMHLVVSTRDDPHLPLARLRARGQLTELRAADLRFSRPEAAEFLNRMMGLHLSEEDVAALEARTEGWIVGLQLAAISLKGQRDASSFIKSFAGSHRFVLDYLIEEVLERQSEAVQTFLCQTAILERLSGSLCDALTGQNNGQATLEALEHANLFIVPLDEERHWYRYHQLFSDLLRHRVCQTQPEQVLALHQRASQWYEQKGFVDEAINHALHSNGFERATQLLDEYVDTLWEQGKHRRLRGWLEQLPDEVLVSRPSLCVFHAWYLFTQGERDAAERALQVAEQASASWATRAGEALRPDGEAQLSDASSASLVGRIAAVRAIMATYRGNVPEIIKHAGKALDYLPRRDWTMRSIAAMALGDAHGFLGDMGAAYRARLEVLEMSESRDESYVSTIAHLKVAITLREQGRLLPTLEICQRQMRVADESGLSRGL